MRVFALTGTLAAGKSAVARLFERWGATIVDADRIVHELQRPGEAVYDAIVRRFGADVVADDGTLDRAALRAIVLEHPDMRGDLERIVHPAVEARRRAAIADAARHGAAVVVVEIPLLFEAADPAAYDGVVVVDAPRGERMRRLTENRGIDVAQAEALMAAQWPPEQKRRRATWIIDNDSTTDALEQRALEVWNELLR